MTKQDFMKQVNKKLASTRDPKMKAARKCMNAARIHKIRAMRAKHAKPKLQ